LDDSFFCRFLLVRLRLFLFWLSGGGGTVKMEVGMFLDGATAYTSFD
jgi:hypothetical protein